MSGMLALAAAVSSAFASTDDVPKGTLEIDRSLVRVGAHSQLGWQINYPSTSQSPVTDVVDVTDTGTIIPKGNLKMRVRVLGVAFQSGNTLLPIEASWSKNSSNFGRFFYGNANHADPTEVLIETTVEKNEKIHFRARGRTGSNWNPFHSTASMDPHVVVVKNGDKAPNHAPAYNQGSVRSFLSTHIDGKGRVKIGPRDLIVLWECSTDAPGTTNFDMQDLVVLVTFE